MTSHTKSATIINFEIEIAACETLRLQLKSQDLQQIYESLQACMQIVAERDKILE